MADESTSDDALAHRWTVLRATALRSPDEIGLQIALAQGAVNAIARYGEHGRWEEMATARADLSAVAERFPDNPEIQQARARGEALVQKLRRPGT